MYPYLYVGTLVDDPPPTGEDICDLYNGRLRVLSSWLPKSAMIGEAVTEQIPCFFRSTNPTDVRAELLKLEKLFRRARDYLGNRSGNDPIGLAWGPQGSNYPALQYSLILDGRVHWDASLSEDSFLEEGGFDNIILIEVERLAGWELYTPTTPSGTGLHPAWAGVKILNNTMGSQPARLEVRTVGGYPGFSHYWFGIRYPRMGMADFDPEFECENGTMLIADTTTGTVSGASGGNGATTTFATDATLVDRLDVRFDDEHSSVEESHWVGTYQVLLRCKLSATAVVGIQMGICMQGTNNADATFYPEIFLEDTEWRVLPMGVITLPLAGEAFNYTPTVLDRMITYTRWIFRAERLSGSGNLIWDCFVLLPTDGSAFIKSKRQSGGSYQSDLNIHSRRDGLNVAVFGENSPSSIALAESANFVNWGMPSDGAILVQVLHNDLAPNVADTVSLYVKYWPTSELFVDRTVTVE